MKSKQLIFSREQQMYIKNQDPEEERKYQVMFRENPIIIHGTKQDLRKPNLGARLLQFIRKNFT